MLAVSIWGCRHQGRLRASCILGREHYIGLSVDLYRLVLHSMFEKETLLPGTRGLEPMGKFQFRIWRCACLGGKGEEGGWA